MAERKGTNGQTTIYETLHNLHRKHRPGNINPTKNRRWTRR